MPIIDGSNVTQYTNLNVEGLLFVNGDFVNIQRSGNFTTSNVTNFNNSLHVTGRLFVDGVEAVIPSNSGGIDAYADAGGGLVTVTTDANSFLADGLEVTISTSTNYNGTFTILNATDATFDIEIAFNGDDMVGIWTVVPATPSNFKGTRLTNVNIIGEYGLNDERYVT